MGKLEFETNRREIYRYLGCRGQLPPEQVIHEVERCVEELEKQVTPRYVYRKYAVTITQEADREKAPLIVIEEAGMAFRSRNLAKNLRGCKEVYLMAATLGPGPDRLIKRASVHKVSQAVIYQAASAAMEEDWCDVVNRKIAAEAAGQGLFCRPRFSPGYGDFPLETQADFSRALNMPKMIGVGLTDTFLMAPSKSVTALIGVSEEEKPCNIHGCEECSASGTCAYRRNTDTDPV